MSFRTMQINGLTPAELVVAAGDGPTLIMHADSDGGFLVLGDSPAASPDDSYNSIPLTSGSYVTVDGESDVYAIAESPTSFHTISLIPGGLNFFLAPNTVAPTNPIYNSAVAINRAPGSGNANLLTGPLNLRCWGAWLDISVTSAAAYAAATATFPTSITLPSGGTFLALVPTIFNPSSIVADSLYVDMKGVVVDLLAAQSIMLNVPASIANIVGRVSGGIIYSVPLSR